MVMSWAGKFEFLIKTRCNADAIRPPTFLAALVSPITLPYSCLIVEYPM